MCAKHYQRLRKYGDIYNKGRWALLEKECPNCRKIFRDVKSRLERRECCSRKCHAEYITVREVFYCKYCFRLNQKSPHRGDPNLYCDRSCSAKHRSVVAQEIKSLKTISKNQAKAKAIRDVSYSDMGVVALIWADKFMSPKIQKMARVAQCLYCQRDYIVGQARARGFCSDDCKDQSIDRTRRRAKKSAAYRIAKLKNKTKRRVRIKSTKVDSVDPLVIFKRDLWECYICGTSTPRSLRNKNKPQSPELDHVMPLSKGGHHIETNVACCCRSCNLKKSDRTPLDIITAGGMW